jgi:anti-sigma-K factor RskA
MMSERLLRDLHAYHDGELRGLRRWWVERRIAASPAARAELERLRELGAALRSQAEQAPAPDLWGAIVMQLPPALPAANTARRERDGFGFTLPKWAGALVAAGAVAVAFLAIPGGGPTAPSSGAVRGSAVQLLDTGRRPAVILQDDAEATIILLLPKQSANAGRISDVVG